MICYLLNFVMNKDYKAVGEYYEEKQETEFLMCHYLNKNLPEFLKKQGIFFEVQVKGQYNKSDIALIKIPPDREKKILIANVEYENGANQVEWDYELPKHKWQALNLVTRKKYGETFSLFIKSSRTFNSFFAIDCRNGFIQKNFGENAEILEHNLEFETNNEFYRIYWIDVDKYQYIDDTKNKILKNSNICIIENNDWSIFYMFLWRRFLDK